MRSRVHSAENGMKNSNLGMTVYGNLGQHKRKSQQLGYDSSVEASKRCEKMDITFKKIDFEKSLHYYLKDKNYYKPSDCHINAYIRFFDKNYEEVERRDLHFSYVTGLMLFTDGEQKYCVVHSWIEDRGMVIDTTSLSSSQLALVSSPSTQLICETKKIIDEHVSYVPFFVISNVDFTKKTQELYLKSNRIENKLHRAVEDYLKSICDSVSHDSKFLYQIHEKFGYEFKQGDFLIGIYSRF